MKNPIFIFDLDETLIDSVHRVKPCYESDGSLNLEKYIHEACTRKLIMRDKLLPLVRVFHQLRMAGETVFILTARGMSCHDFEFLAKHGLCCDRILSRANCLSEKHYSMRDGAYKLQWIKSFQGLKQYANRDIIMIDDNKSVKTALRQAGIIVLCAHKLNARLAKNRV